MTKEELKKLFVERCTTSHRAIDTKTGKAMLYLRKDLTDMAKSAYESGKSSFHCKPADPNQPYGKLVECEPEYEYVLSRPLTPEEYKSLFTE